MITAVLFIGIVGLGAAGAVTRIFVDDLSIIMIKLFDLDYEKNIPTLFSASILAACAVVTFAAVDRGIVPRTTWLMTFVFAEMALDEIFGFHERLDAQLEIDWQILYLPVFVMAGVGWLMLARRLLNETGSLVLWFCGAVVWFASQLLEDFQWGGFSPLSSDEPAEAYAVLMICEELLEMTGSLLFLAALLRTYQRYENARQETSQVTEES